MTTPADLEVLIHYHCTPGPHPRIDSPLVEKATSKFIRDGIIELAPQDKSRDVVFDSFNTTAKGRAWLAMILQVEYPQEAWIDATGKIVG